MKKPILYFIGILLLMVAFSLLIYPTPYRYLQYMNGGSFTQIKVNNFTGHTQRYVQETGWVDD
ncbi:hypothetical protein SAMN04487895_104210 [Paenibacillus sophorae]|uniref:Uncharacterized protein n=1 Tax=Paenibacillus sophorae TaxID=1333845 RepID=A0A1H8L7A7_9BACL|nr:hypothetical protein [Paenibacillus sophorae]QWU17404.1 hypothetical protein KP014_09750 [Paenibacillus sophorae]SEO00961.1 hypothetical protein SAMN04487895_104210 [Paenibacillus sophorae]